MSKVGYLTKLLSMGSAARQEKAEEIRRINIGILSLPLPSEGNISPHQIAKMSEKTRKGYCDKVISRFLVEDQINDYMLSDTDLQAAIECEERREAKDRVCQLLSQLKEFETLSLFYGANKYKKASKEALAELTKINDKYNFLEVSR